MGGHWSVTVRDRRSLVGFAQPRLNDAELKVHCNVGSMTSAFRGHPLCEFCRQHFYDDEGRILWFTVSCHRVLHTGVALRTSSTTCVSTPYVLVLST